MSRRDASLRKEKAVADLEDPGLGAAGSPGGTFLATSVGLIPAPSHIQHGTHSCSREAGLAAQGLIDGPAGHCRGSRRSRPTYYIFLFLLLVVIFLMSLVAL
eukprot:RCo044153